MTATKNLVDLLTLRAEFTAHLDKEECIEEFVSFLESEAWEPSESEDETNELAIGVWHYCNDYHGGQNSQEYSWLSRIPLSNIDLDGEAEMYYTELGEQ